MSHSTCLSLFSCAVGFPAQKPDFPSPTFIQNLSEGWHFNIKFELNILHQCLLPWGWWSWTHTMALHGSNRPVSPTELCCTPCHGLIFHPSVRFCTSSDHYTTEQKWNRGRGKVIKQIATERNTKSIFPKTRSLPILFSFKAAEYSCFSGQFSLLTLKENWCSKIQHLAGGKNLDDSETEIKTSSFPICSLFFL